MKDTNDFPIILIGKSLALRTETPSSVSDDTASVKNEGFLYQKSFWLYVGLVTTLLIFVAPMVWKLIVRVIDIVLPIKIGWFTADILLFVLTLLVGIYFKHTARLIWIWLAISVLLVATRPLILIENTQTIQFIVLVVFSIITLVGIAWWTNKCFQQIGSVDIPAQAVLVRVGKGIKAIGPGLYFKFVPFEGYKVFPLGQYTGNYSIESGLYSKENPKKKLSSHPLTVDIAFYFRFAEVGKNYSFTKKDKSVMEMRGEDLLIKSHNSLPVNDLLSESAVDEINLHFGKGIIGGVRHIMSAKDSEECRIEKPEIEEEITTYLLQEEGNPLSECGIPRELLDIELTRVKIPDEMEKAYMAPEISRKDAEAAEHDQLATGRRMRGFTDEGASPDIASLATTGIKGDGMSTDQIRDLVIMQVFKEGSFFKEKSSRRKRQSKKS